MKKFNFVLSAVIMAFSFQQEAFSTDSWGDGSKKDAYALPQNTRTNSRGQENPYAKKDQLNLYNQEWPQPDVTNNKSLMSANKEEFTDNMDNLAKLSKTSGEIQKGNAVKARGHDSSNFSKEKK